MMLPPGDRVRLILAAADWYRPDVLVTAGYAVHSRKQLHWLAREVAEDPRQGVLVTEVHYDGRRRYELGRSHAMYAILGDGALHRFGRQAFSTSLEACHRASPGLVAFRRKIPRRTLRSEHGSIFALICGELNIVQGRLRPAFVDEEARAAMKAADIIVNPTHDRMSNAGTLDAKRRLLSLPHEDGRGRAYVSVSNWEACGLNGRVQQPSPTLHTVYVAGKPIEYEELADGAFGFVYRRWQLDLSGRT
ncbi:hypothetical protein [Sphingomonas phyllosphaerae]|uniref:hypothetical protein n=1 Tax=Sphingomonas phyllosphaerae TaxID=257003 RepID=UPI002413CAD6|nr:hypothetical protein [Sphingomonas phyllosphaerae]